MSARRRLFINTAYVRMCRRQQWVELGAFCVQEFLFVVFSVDE